MRITEDQPDSNSQISPMRKDGRDGAKTERNFEQDDQPRHMPMVSLTNIRILVRSR